MRINSAGDKFQSPPAQDGMPTMRSSAHHDPTAVSTYRFEAAMPTPKKQPQTAATAMADAELVSKLADSTRPVVHSLAARKPK